MEPLKEMFNKTFYQHFANSFAQVYTGFDATHFIQDALQGIDALSLNGRLRNTSLLLKKYLPASYTQSLAIIYKAAPLLKTGYTALVLPDFVALYGKEHFNLSMDALQRFTRLGSSEFAIRAFLQTDLQQTLAVMQEWAADKDPHVRRLASEGSRPRLPWSFKLDAIINDPLLTAPILEQLKTDEELYVRKSVANHLNDISKDNTAYMLRLVKGWDATHPHTRWIIKHASRTLIKKGNKDSLTLFAFEKNVQLRLHRFKLSTTSIRLGEELSFEFTVTSEKNSPQKLVIDYAIHYAKATGAISQKVFKLKELNLLPQQSIRITKKQVFKDLTTRKHYAGKHVLELLVNGKIMRSKRFTLQV